MRAVVQRVKKARVDISGRTVGEIGQGLLVFLGVGEEDSEKEKLPQNIFKPEPRKCWFRLQ